MYRSLGMDLPQCAKFLHVTERTLHNWESGKHDIPYATFKLLRLMNGLELPGKTWAGWEFRGGKLWSPEGRSFEGTDGSWWSLLVRQAHGFRELMARGAMRIGEVLKLTPNDIAERKLLLREPKSGREVEIVFIPQKVADRLQEYVRSEKIGLNSRIFQPRRFTLEILATQKL